MRTHAKLGQPAGRFLIVNADDFGHTTGINRGIIEAHERGIASSASLLVRYPAAQEAADYAREHPELSVGLHFDLMEWRYAGGSWKQAYEVADASDAAAVRTEAERQLARFTELLGREPTHLDSHQHVHRREPTHSILQESAEHRGVSLRNFSSTVAYCGEFYGQTDNGEPYPEGITPTRLCAIIKAVPSGWTELGCHPGYAGGLDSVYLAEREAELRALCSPEVREELERQQVTLSSYHDLYVPGRS